ncbi:MAG: STAS domain-containing protein [Planctomycetia bacterium]|nr:STAS domain-containing protein [Planctomycetia bacterium]
MNIQINHSKENGLLKISLSGRLDTTTSPVAEMDIRPLLDDVENIEMDLSGLEYISSAGLRTLLAIKKSIPETGVIKLFHVRGEIREVFDMTGFSNIFVIE